MTILGTVASSFRSAAGSYESIASFTATQNITTISFTSIPSTYRHLEVRYVAKSNRANAVGDLQMRINNISTNTYDFAIFYSSNGATPAHETGIGISIALAGQVNGTTTNSEYFASGYIIIPDYTSTVKEKTIQYYSGGLGQVGSGAGSYLGVANNRNTSAIDRLDFLVNVTNNDFTTSTTFALYGIKSA